MSLFRFFFLLIFVCIGKNSELCRNDNIQICDFLIANQPVVNLVDQYHGARHVEHCIHMLKMFNGKIGIFCPFLEFCGFDLHLEMFEHQFDQTRNNWVSSCSVFFNDVNMQCPDVLQMFYEKAILLANAGTIETCNSTGYELCATEHLKSCTDVEDGFVCENCADYSETKPRPYNLECQDINECANGVCGPLAVRCVDLNPKYTCECKDGFQFNDSIYGSGCEDIDECLQPGQCPENFTECQNHVGLFSCVCQSGYARPTGSTECTEIQMPKLVAFEVVSSNAASPSAVNCSVNMTAGETFDSITLTLNGIAASFSVSFTSVLGFGGQQLFYFSFDSLNPGSFYSPVVKVDQNQQNIYPAFVVNQTFGTYPDRPEFFLFANSTSFLNVYWNFDSSDPISANHFLNISFDPVVTMCASGCFVQMSLAVKQVGALVENETYTVSVVKTSSLQLADASTLQYTSEPTKIVFLNKHVITVQNVLRYTNQNCFYDAVRINSSEPFNGFRLLDSDGTTDITGDAKLSAIEPTPGTIDVSANYMLELGARHQYWIRLGSDSFYRGVQRLFEFIGNDSSVDEAVFCATTHDKLFDWNNFTISLDVQTIDGFQICSNKNNVTTIEKKRTCSVLWCHNSICPLSFGSYRYSFEAEDADIGEWKVEVDLFFEFYLPNIQLLIEPVDDHLDDKDNTGWLPINDINYGVQRASAYNEPELIQRFGGQGRWWLP